LWKENHQGFEVESAKILTPNLLTFQLVTGDERFYCMGVYIPPTDTMGVEGFLDKYVSHAVGNHYFMQWSKSNRTKTFLDKVTASDIAYTILVYENSNEVWKEEVKTRGDLKNG
jgi:hypothetical protein